MARRVGNAYYTTSKVQRPSSVIFFLSQLAAKKCLCYLLVESKVIYRLAINRIEFSLHYAAAQLDWGKLKNFRWIFFWFASEVHWNHHAQTPAKNEGVIFFSLLRFAKLVRNVPLTDIYNVHFYEPKRRSHFSFRTLFTFGKCPGKD